VEIPEAKPVKVEAEVKNEPPSSDSIETDQDMGGVKVKEDLEELEAAKAKLMAGIEQLASQD